MRETLRSIVSDHPAVDLIPVAAVVIVLFVIPARLSGQVDHRLALYGAATAFAGLVLAAATFVCTLTYQSTSYLMSDIRKTHANAIRRNWVSILTWVLLAGAADLAAFVVDPSSPRVAVGIVLCSLVLVLAKGLRSIWWLKFTLFVDHASELSPPRLPFKRPSAAPNQSGEARVSPLAGTGL
jgi:hypothetical protein